MADINDMPHQGGRRIDEATGTETVGHEWDGIEELNTPLPRWWVFLFYACIAFAIGYVFAYPAIPLLHGGTPGLLGWTSRGTLASETDTASAARKPVLDALAVTPIEQLPAHPNLMQAAIAGGRAAFKVNCVQCHGAGAAGRAKAMAGIVMAMPSRLRAAWRAAAMSGARREGTASSSGRAAPGKGGCAVRSVLMSMLKATNRLDVVTASASFS